MNSDIEQLIIVGVLLVLLAEVTYIVAKLPNRPTNSKGHYIFVDTSVLIDGRIMAVAQSGFITGTLAIPRSVIGELQFLADNADSDKRAKARQGLDLVKELQEIENLDVEIFQDGSKAEEGVDERLLTLAKQYNGSICTIDYNLNKVAVVEGIRVCNVNELAKNLRMAYLPGEKMNLELVQKGQDSHQGVGYLEDGTMVVVEQASKYVGQKIEVEFIRSLQTAAGKMMFAKIVEKQGVAKPKRSNVTKNTSAKGRKPQVRKQPQQNSQNTQKTSPKKPAQTKNNQRKNYSKSREDELVRLANQ